MEETDFRFSILRSLSRACTSPSFSRRAFCIRMTSDTKCNAMITKRKQRQFPISRFLSLLPLPPTEATQLPSHSIQVDNSPSSSQMRYVTSLEEQSSRRGRRTLLHRRRGKSRSVRWDEGEEKDDRRLSSELTMTSRPIHWTRRTNRSSRKSMRDSSSVSAMPS